METTTQQQRDSSLAKPLAAEDIAIGDYVAPLSVAYEYPSFLWCGDAAFAPREEPVRIRFRAGNCLEPALVREICLPLVFVKLPRGRYATIDIRSVELARLDRGYARRVWKALAGTAKAKKKRGGKKKKR